MKTFPAIIQKHRYQLYILLIILIAVFCRFYRYPDRWGLAYDQAHDAVVARYALSAWKIPLVGPFSSAGPFQTGGEWYWFIMLGTLMGRGHVMAPWIFLTLASVLSVFLSIRIGKELINDEFGILLGLLTAISTAQIAQSTNLTNQSPLALFSLIAIWSSIRYTRTHKPIYLFTLSFCVALGVSVHLQGVALVILLMMTVVGNWFLPPSNIIFAAFGLFIPTLPLLLFDFNNKFINIHNMLYYYQHDQYRVSFEVLGRRWTTYLGTFWIQEWGHIIGNYRLVIEAVLFIGFVIFLHGLLRKKMKREGIIIVCSFIGMVTLIRYTRAPLYASYLTFLHPFVLIITAVILYKVYRKLKIIGLFLLGAVVVGSMLANGPEIFTGTNQTAELANRYKNALTVEYPNRKFVIWDFEYTQNDVSIPLVLFLDAAGKIDDQGLNFGIVTHPAKAKLLTKPIVSKGGWYQLFDMSSSTSAQMTNAGWAFVNPRGVYAATEEWHHN